MNDCLFCRIIKKEVPSYMIYEDNQNMAILDIYPSVRGQAIVLPKKHFGSYVFEMNEEDFFSLMLASKKVARLIDGKLGSIRTCMVMEGMEVDHAHIKLYPIYEVINRVASGTIDLNKYPGYLCTLHGKEAPSHELEGILERFK